MTNIITINELKNSVLNANIDDEYIQPAIDEAQSIYLREILGDALLNAIINKINGNSLTGKYLILVNDYVKPYLSYMIQSIIVVPITYKIRNAGVIQQYDNGFTTTQMKDTQYLKDYYDGKAEFYGNRLTEWLRKNANDIVEYRLSASNVTNPTTSQNVTNIFLGGTKRGKCGYVSTSGGGGTHDTVDWDDITNRPDFATVATSGSYNDLNNKPEIPSLDGYATEQWVENQGYSTFSGDYNDLTNKPELFSGDYNDLENKPNLATVATSGSYDDLSNKPEIPTVNNATLTITQGGATKGTFTANAGTDVTIDLEAGGSGSTDWNDIQNKPDFATVATSGSYNDLNDIPSYFSYIHENGSQNGVMLDGETQFGEITADIAGGIQCNFKVDKSASTKLYSDYIITGENTNGRTELVISGDDGNNVYGKIAKDGIYEGNTKLENKYLKINDLPTNVSAFNNDAGYLTQHQSLDGYATEQWVENQGYSTFSGDYNDLENKPEIPTVNNGTLTIKQGGVTKGTFTANSNENIEINLEAGGSGSTDWNDIANKPDFATVATTGSYSDLSNTPSLATVATSGDYRDLEAKPDLSIYAVTDDLATVATSGNYNDLINKPDLAQVATSGDYRDLNNKPDLAQVATSGDYRDLSNTPTIPTLVQADWSETDSAADDFIKNKPNLGAVATSNNYRDLDYKPDLAQVATSGDYRDLNNKPNFAAVATSGDYHDLTHTPTIVTPVNANWTETDPDELSYILNKPDLAQVATSGDYRDLSNTPSLGAVATSNDYQDLDNKPTIPTVNDGSLTIQQNGTTIATFTANDDTNKTANITVPTDETDLGLSTETWTFTLQDGTNVTKTVVIK